ncbi:MAG: glycosyltransferase family 4 protein [Planctomycetota bacterium]|nr:glycosyltransferase family 4 protein [Planctomycetota bacterium]
MFLCTCPRVFFGGVNVFLQQKSAFFRRGPRWLDRLLDAGWLLRRLARRAGATEAKDLGELTVSMLSGPLGRQKKELDRLIEFLQTSGKPEAIVLSNALLLGLAGEIRTRVGCPVLCMLQDEHELADALEEPWRGRAWELMREKIRLVTAVAASSRYYADRMAQRLALPRERIHIIYNGVEAGDYAPPSQPPDPPVIGYLTRMHKDFGLDVLAEAFIQLTRGDRGQVRLALSGGQVGGDKRFVRSVRRRLEQAGLGDRVEWVGDFDSPGKRAFLARLAVLCVPGRTEAAAGLAVLEALAAGLPCVGTGVGDLPQIAQQCPTVLR